jgi:hypothetical protein
VDLFVLLAGTSCISEALLGYTPMYVTKHLREVNFFLQCTPDLITKSINFYRLAPLEFCGIEYFVLEA